MNWSRVTCFFGLMFLGGGLYACIESSGTTRGPDGQTPSSSVASGTSTGSGMVDAFDKNALLDSLVGQVIAPTQDAFIEAAATLEKAAGSYAESLDSADLKQTRDAFVAAMKLWQRLEMMQVGPAGAMGTVVGGQDLRDEIYSWPTVNPCRIDQETVEGVYLDPSTFQAEHINVRGLDALEYLLFNESTDNSCPPQNSINSNGSWDAVPDLAQARAQYAQTLAVLTRQRAEALRSAWKNGFAGELTSAGKGSGLFPSAQAGLNAIADALFYLDKETKDMKLAVPAGLSDCDDETCPSALESRFARISKEAIRANIEGFRLLFTGGEGLGFDDWLTGLGAETLATKMLKDIDAAIASLEAIEEPTLLEALSSDRKSVETAYFAVKAVTDELKSQFVGVLDLELPKAVEGDND